jgi:hypothetical protein
MIDGAEIMKHKSIKIFKYLIVLLLILFIQNLQMVLEVRHKPIMPFGRAFNNWIANAFFVVNHIQKINLIRNKKLFFRLKN